MIKCGECVRHDNCWLYDEHKDDNGTCVWAESKSITESPNEVVEKNDEVIESKVDHTRIDHDREWIIGCIQHDGFIKTDRFDKANQIILEALEPTEPSDLISRADLLDTRPEFLNEDMYDKERATYNKGWNDAIREFLRNINSLPSSGTECTDFIHWLSKVVTDEELWELNAVGYGEIICRKLVKVGALATTEKPPYYYVPSVSAERVGEWIPCSERLPSDDEIVNITWVNHNPPPYYADIGEKPFVASGLRYRGKWYWYSSVCQDSHQDFDLIDKDIEVIAWQPLPKPYECGAKMKGGAE